MARRPFTFVMIADDRTTVRQFHLTRAGMITVAATTLLLVAALGALAGHGIADRPASTEVDGPLVAENFLLEKQLDGMQRTVDSLRASLAALTVKDEYMRLLAGVAPIDPNALGGAGVATSAARLLDHPLYSLDRFTARKAFFLATDLDAMVERARLLRDSWHEVRDTLLHEYQRLAATPSILPTDGYISSVYSHERWHPILGRTRPHLGLDIVAPVGTAIVAAARGRVRFVGRNGEYGLTVEIDHGFGFVTRYAHASETKVRRGQTVERGEVIALVGQTGLAIGPHLHYEVLVDDRADDPRKYVLETRVITD